MNTISVNANPSGQWPAAWRFVVIVLCTLIFSACKGPSISCPPPPCGGAPGLPPQAYSGMPVGACPAARPVQNGSMNCGIPEGAWAPSGIRRPWPPDEYLCDGGDTGYPATVTPDWELRGFEPTDTIAHFDTLDGETIVQPSNRVCLYAPRFGSVRKVTGVEARQQNIQLAGVSQPVQLTRVDDIQKVEAGTQNVETIRAVAALGPVIAESEQHDGAVSRKLGVGVSSAGRIPFENLLRLQAGLIEDRDRAIIAAGVDAAIVWSDPQGVMVLLDNQAAAEVVRDEKVEVVFAVDEPPANPKLRLIKCASTAAAKPGDTVEFVIRFDNVGNQPIGNVVIADNLIGRLECDPESLFCTRPANFDTSRNESGSVVVRCELTEPLPPGEGGVLRFHCRVR